MDKTDRETHDFMNVESFSQLPFISPAPAKEKGIKLFGIEFGTDSGTIPTSASSEEPERTAGENTSSEEVKESNKDENAGESGRRFECHYCCRNFPTSQALGGHQNAHKRERQHAKRAHLQSAMVHGSLSDAHVYGFMNYRLGSGPTTSPYPSWNTNNASTSNRFFGSNHSHSSFSHQQPINGSPLALWRIPSAVQTNPTLSRDRPSSLNPLPLFAVDHDMTMKQSAQAINGSVSDSLPQGRYVYDAKPKQTMQDHVSLDLHL